MRSASILRTHIEAALADRIPSALTPVVKMTREVTPTGIAAIDALLEGGFPVGAITEMIGPECSGRTALALSFLAQITKTERVCAWIDVSNTLSPESAASSGVDIRRLLWIRCGVLPPCSPVFTYHGDFVLPENYLAPAIPKKGLHGGGFGPHPRMESKGLSKGVGDFLRHNAITPLRPPPQHTFQDVIEPHALRPANHRSSTSTTKPWSRIEQALRATDLLLQGGGFSAIVLDLGSIAPEVVSRIPLATWFRYSASAERSHASVLLLTQHACTKSSAGLVMRLEARPSISLEKTVLPGLNLHLEVSRQRLTEALSNVVPLRKPPHKANAAIWQSKTVWSGVR